MSNGNNGERIKDGTMAFEGGIDSGRIPTIQGPQNPNGLKRNMLAWMTNANCRGGGLNVRTGWKRLCKVANGNIGLYQGGYLYQPDNADPYLTIDLAGRNYRVRVDTDNSVQDITGVSSNPPGRPQHWIVQAENFMIIQDGVSEPLVWDGTSMRRISAMGGAAPYLPTGEMMDYYMGRVWVAAGREYMAGDIVLGPSGTGNLRDSVLHASENTYLTGGGKFVVPSTAGNIRAMAHAANLDTALGQGNLFVFTRKSIYSTSVPATRTEWQNLSEPLQRVALINYGTVSDRSIVPVNGDLFFRSMDGVRSLQLAIRYFQQWGNIPISRQENRVLRFDDRSILRYTTGIQFDNRLWMSALPRQTVNGIVHQGILPLDFDLISSLEEKLPPVWEGMLEGLDILQMFVGDFGGLERAFAVIVSRLTGDIEVWEFTTTEREDIPEAASARIPWYFETPAYTWGDSFQLKELDSLELWLDRLAGEVDFHVYYRVDQNPCWIFWKNFQICSAKNTCEDVSSPICYPSQPYCDGYKATLTLEKPPVMSIEINQQRPSTWGYQFQIKVVIKGWCRIRGLLVHARKRDVPPYENMV